MELGAADSYTSYVKAVEGGAERIGGKGSIFDIVGGSGVAEGKVSHIT